ncbi:hypothetical protein AVEN_93064-1 [Araneus ventricosus]|uniref:Uncharacterized protein n=1 Tax=Araneus ventricosus TaxID=182803 RepID=A0A4Y2Q151_ARAVE|nr:hypothetical protein AVEN_93064-1 [Araneus ventricosus]
MEFLFYQKKLEVYLLFEYFDAICLPLEDQFSFTLYDMALMVQMTDKHLMQGPTGKAATGSGNLPSLGAYLECLAGTSYAPGSPSPGMMTTLTPEPG